MIIKITLIVLMISNIALWISHTNMKCIIGHLLTMNMENLNTLKKLFDDDIEGDDRK